MVSAEATLRWMLLARRVLVALGLGCGGVYLVAHPPVCRVGPDEVGLRTNRITGRVAQWRDGTVLVVPGLHRVRVVPVRPAPRVRTVV